MIMAMKTEHISMNLGAFQLKDISLSIPKGKITGIVGPNGSGKSTLLKVMTRLLTADHGAVYVQDKNSSTYKAKDFAKTVSMLPQSKDNLPNLTVRELITFGRSPYKGFFNNQMTDDDESIILEAMQMTGTKKHESRLFSSLSGGEQQKVRIAMALAQKTEILLLDEPTTYLDIAHQLDVMELLLHINQRYNTTIIMVLHDLQQTANYCDFMIAMKQGKVVDSGTPPSTLTADFLRHVFEINARVLYEDDYPLIIPKTRFKGRKK